MIIIYVQINMRLWSTATVNEQYSPFTWKSDNWFKKIVRHLQLLLLKKSQNKSIQLFIFSINHLETIRFPYYSYLIPQGKIKKSSLFINERLKKGSFYLSEIFSTFWGPRGLSVVKFRVSSHLWSRRTGSVKRSLIEKQRLETNLFRFVLLSSSATYMLQI